MELRTNFWSNRSQTKLWFTGRCHVIPVEVSDLLKTKFKYYYQKLMQISSNLPTASHSITTKYSLTRAHFYVVLELYTYPFAQLPLTFSALSILRFFFLRSLPAKHHLELDLIVSDVLDILNSRWLEKTHLRFTEWKKEIQRQTLM